MRKLKELFCMHKNFEMKDIYTSNGVIKIGSRWIECLDCKKQINRQEYMEREEFPDFSHFGQVKQKPYFEEKI